MTMFEYVMVLVSIIIGLAMTHLLQGLLDIVQRRPRIYWVHLVWVAWVFFQTTFWWWWQFRYNAVETWTFPLYLFIIGYAFLLYLLCGLLFPASLEGYGDFKTYFYERRAWFFAVFVVIFAVDVADSALKGADYLARLGPRYLIANTLFATAGVVAAFVRNERYHAILVVGLFAYMLLFSLSAFFTPTG
jgi:hypothetical protein